MPFCHTPKGTKTPSSILKRSNNDLCDNGFHIDYLFIGSRQDNAFAVPVHRSCSIDKKISSKQATSASISPVRMINGGIKRKTFSWTQLMRNPFSRHFATIGPPSNFSSMAKRRPDPRTSVIDRCLFLSHKSFSLKYDPTLRQWSMIFSSSSTLTTSNEAAVTIGVPPKVVAWDPGPNAEATCFFGQHSTDR